MSDTYTPPKEGGDEGGAEDPTAAAVAAAMGVQTPIAPEPAAPAEESIPGLDALPDSWQAHIKELRAENKQRREALQGYEQAFSGFEPDFAQYVQQVIGAMTSSNETVRKQAAEELDHWAKQLGGNPATAGDNEPEPAPAGQPTPTPKSAQEAPVDTNALLAQVAKMLDERDQKTQVRSAAQKMIDDAVGLGYEVGSIEYAQLMTVAGQMGNDVKVAHTKMEEATAAKVAAAIEAAQGQAGKYPKQDAQKGHGVPAEGGTEDWIGDINKTGEMARRAFEAMANDGN
jgi:hypothetical protein